MILKKIYDEKTKTQKVWYDSSMIFYSEMIEDENENVGDLYITFKNGSCYKYNKVKFEDYVVFVAGGTDASQGKTLNKVIKGKYDYERVEDSNMTLLTEQLYSREDVDNSAITYFISGQMDLTETEFEINYIPMINKALHDTENAHFIIGDDDCADIFAQNYLMDIIGLSPDNISVYYIGENPKFVNQKITNLYGGYSDYDERNSEMTKKSFKDIAFVRNCSEASEVSKNILRRHILTTL